MNSTGNDIGVIGLGVMGANLLMNMADKGFSVAGYDKDSSKVESLRKDTEGKNVHPFENIRDFINNLDKPRAILMLVPAGGPVDSVIQDLSGYLEKGDLIVDGGNSYFKDTKLRGDQLREKGILYMGVGISGGEEGARNGPSIMPGGPEEGWQRVQNILEAVSAKVNGQPCVTYLGPEASGHFVKMVHNGIEYGLMQLIAESYALLKQGLNFSDDDLQQVYENWNDGPLNGYLMEITGRIFGKIDEKTNKKLIDQILDVARQKGTGMWTSQSAMELQVPIPTIDIAVTMRDLSVYEDLRESAYQLYEPEQPPVTIEPSAFLRQMQNALYVSMILTYAQGFALLKKASEKYHYNLDMEAVARIWRGGCIIRSAILEDIRSAFGMNKDLSDLLLDPVMAEKIKNNVKELRQIVCLSGMAGIPVPGLMVTLSYFDAFCSSWLPANLIQAQRDYFGAHTYERIDAKGTFHTEWEQQS
jgi:6-phosphogluconate dehydrogenase